MLWKTTVVLALLTIGIGAYVSLVELRRPTAEQRERLARQVADLSPETVTSLVLDMPQGAVTLTRGEQGWRLAPSGESSGTERGVRASETLVNQLLYHLSPLTATRILTASAERPLGLQGFGLDPAVGSMTVTAEGLPMTLRFGDATPVGQHRYLKRSDRAEVFVVSEALFTDANQPPEAFRDVQLIKADAWSTEALAVDSPELTLGLSLMDTAWRITVPLNDLADRSEVQLFLNRLAGLSIKRFTDDDPQVEQLAFWGFDHPRAEITLHPRGAPPVLLVFGSQLSEDISLRFAKRSDEHAIYAVSAAELDALVTVDPHGFRAKACFDFFTSQVTKLEIRQAGAGWAVTQTEGQWYEEGAHTPLESRRLSELLSQLADLRISGFVDDEPTDLERYGLAPPAATISVWVRQQPFPQQLLVGAAVEEATARPHTNLVGVGARYGRIEGRQAVVRLPEDITKILDTTPR